MDAMECSKVLAVSKLMATNGLVIKNLWWQMGRIF